MKQSGHLNPSEKTATGCPITSKYGRTPLNKHGGVGRQQQHGDEWIRGLVFGFRNPVGTGGVLGVCLLCCGGEGGDWVAGLDQDLEGCGGVISV